jgi:hypothetical protein
MSIFICIQKLTIGIKFFASNTLKTIIEIEIIVNYIINN